MIRVIVAGACGRMGKMIIREVLQQPDMRVVGAITHAAHSQLGLDAGEVAGVRALGVPVRCDLPSILPGSDVVIEFSSPDGAMDGLRSAVEADKAMVIGTTGFTSEALATIRRLAAHVPCVIAPNMSIGANVLFRATRMVAEALGPEYNVEVVETHHRRKVDSPSGTAQRIAEDLAEVFDRNLAAVGVHSRKGVVGPRTDEEIGVHAVRAGGIPGDHNVLFAGAGEQIQIVHRAHSRQAFAQGAIRAARWVVNAPKGLHDITKVLF